MCIAAIFWHSIFDIVFRRAVWNEPQTMQTGVSFMPQVQKVMLVGYDWWISICLVC